MSGLDFFVISVSFLSFLFLVDVCYFIWFWPCWVVIAAWAFSLVAASRGYSPAVMRASHCGGFLLQSAGFRAHGLQ